jgi:hypothetical protein
MATTIQTLFNQANSAITGIDASLITLQEQSDEFNVVTAVANTTIPTANGNVSSTSSTAAYYNKAESDTLYLSTSGGTVTGNITATGFFYANGVSVGGGSGGVTAVNGVVDMSAAYSSLILPTGTYAQRPAAAANGAIRWNSSNNVAEIYTGSSTGWVVLAYGGQYTITYLVAAGGGGGGNRHGGGGGAGGLITGTRLVTPGDTYSASIGAGGSGAPTGGGQLGSNGSNTTALGFTAIGGGGGSSYGDGSNNGPATPSGAATSGGSGGGQGYNTASSGSGTAGQGNPGGSNNSGVPGGGGGGAGATGGVGSGSGAGPGGVGILFSTEGYGYYYAGGGGGGGWTAPGGNGGTGGGGGGAASGPPPSGPGGSAGSGGAGRSPGAAGTADTAGGTTTHGEWISLDSFQRIS